MSRTIYEFPVFFTLYAIFHSSVKAYRGHFQIPFALIHFNTGSDEII